MQEPHTLRNTKSVPHNRPMVFVAKLVKHVKTNSNPALQENLPLGVSLAYINPAVTELSNSTPELRRARRSNRTEQSLHLRHRLRLTAATTFDSNSNKCSPQSALAPTQMIPQSGGC